MRLIEIKEALNYGRTKNRNNGSLLAEARDPHKWETIRNSPAYQGIIQEVRDETAAFLERPLEVLPYSSFKLFFESGSRKEYEGVYFGRRARLKNLALLSLIDGDSQYIHGLEDIIWAICDEYTWCLPAHLHDSGALRDESDEILTQQKGILSRKLRPPEKMLDLFAAETGFALAEILSLLENKLAPEVVNRGRKEIFRRIIEPYYELNPMSWWETATMNWAAVCAGSIGAAAMYLIEDDDVLTPFLYRILETVESFLSGFGMDGACTEGIEYWTYGFGFFVYFAALLDERTAGRIDLFHQKKIEQIALFQQKCYLTGNYVVSFSDASLTHNYRPGLTHYLKKIFPEVKIPDRRYQARLSDDPCQRWAPAIRDLLWWDPESESGLDPEFTEYLADAQWLISKKQHQGKSICFAAKGGNNAEPHNHNDIGSFILHCNGETFLADLGRSEYTRQYFHEERYQFLCTNSRGHSVPVIAGTYQQTGPDFAAKVVDVETSANYDLLRLEIAGAYGNPCLQSLIRTFTFDKSGIPKLILTDVFQFKTIPQSVTERFISYYRPQAMIPGQIRLQGAHSNVDLIFASELFKYRVSQERMMMPHATEQTIYLIDLEIIPIQTKLTAEIAFEINLK